MRLKVLNQDVKERLGLFFIVVIVFNGDEAIMSIYYFFNCSS